MSGDKYERGIRRSRIDCGGGVRRAGVIAAKAYVGGIQRGWAEDVGLEDRNKLAAGFTQNNLVVELVILAAGVVVVHVRDANAVFWRESMVGPDGEEVLSGPLRADETVVADVCGARSVR